MSSLPEIEAVAKRPWELAAEPRPPRDIEAVDPGHEPDVVASAGRLVLALGALGIVFGDIGTSPLYTMQVLFTYHAAHTVSSATVYGLISLIFWELIVVVSVKYAGVIMRVHNRGEGGIMALAALCRRCKVPHTVLLVTLGVFGACLFFGDGVITPAISVLSAVSGLEVPAPGVAKIHTLVVASGGEQQPRHELRGCRGVDLGATAGKRAAALDREGQPPVTTVVDLRAE